MGSGVNCTQVARYSGIALATLLKHNSMFSYATQMQHSTHWIVLETKRMAASKHDEEH